MVSRIRAVLIGVLIAGFFAVPAMADSVSYVLNYGNSGLCGSGSSPWDCTGTSGKKVDPPPYGLVTLTLSGDAKSISVGVQLSGSNVLYASGSFDTIFGFNYTGGPSALNISGLSFGMYSAGSTQLDGFGQFQYSIGTIWSGNNGASLSFTVTRKDGGTFGSAKDLSISNGNGFGFAVDIADTSKCITGTAGTFAAVAPVPEPSSLALFGTGMLIAGGIWRRRSKRE